MGGHFQQKLSGSSARIAARRVPELTAVFWITKALITGASEWWPDYLYGRLGLVAVTGVLGAVLRPGLGSRLASPSATRRWNSGSLTWRGELLLVAALMAILAVAWLRFGLNPVLAFWLAFVLTYPLGGGVASWMASGRDAGGLGLGRWPVSLCLLIAVLGLVAYMAVTSRESWQGAPSTGDL